MPRSRKPSRQTLAVLNALASKPGAWLYGLELARMTGLASGTLYPILIRSAESGLLESRWLEPAEPGRPSRHAYRILTKGLISLQQADAEPQTSGPRLKMA